MVCAPHGMRREMVMSSNSVIVSALEDHFRGREYVDEALDILS